MDLKLIASLLPEDKRTQLPELWQRFQLEHPAATEQQPFLQWLQQQGLYHPAEEVELTLTSMSWLDTTVESAVPPPQEAARSAYVLLGVLGQGAMGLVHLAKDSDLQRKVAYKQLLGEHAKRRISLARFLSEAQITAQLEHPNVVPIYSMETTSEGSLAYTMKLVHGKTFKELMQETRQLLDQDLPLDDEHTPTRLLEHFLKVCDALDYAHSKGVIHRDLKPANIMVGAYNEVYVMDWGIARLIKGEEIPTDDWVELANIHSDEPLEERTQVGQILGTPRYMSPQQAAGKNNQLDGRSDLFSLGLILYELVALKPAITASTPMELLKRVLKAQLEPLVPYHSRFPVAPELRAIIAKATRRKPENRYNSVKDMAADLRRYLKGDAVLAQPDTLLQALLRWIGKNQEITLSLVLVIVVISGLGASWSLYQRQQAMIRAQAREDRITRFLTHVAQQSQTIDVHFQKMETLVHGLAMVTRYALTRGKPADDPLYINNAFAPPGKMFVTPDLLPSPYYTGEISPVWPIYVISPGVSAAQVEKQNRQMAPLRHYLKKMLVTSHTGGPPVPKEKWDNLLVYKGAPILWSYICLKAGVLFFYPGHDEPTQDYDVRIRPYYTLSANKQGRFWGVPYDDPVGGSVLPCTTSIYDSQGKFLGVVGIDLRLNYIIQTLLKFPQASGIRNSYLINDQGQVILKSSDARKPRQRLGLHETFKTPVFEHKAVVQAIHGHVAGGHTEVIQGDSTVMLAYYRLNSLGWYYVVEADLHSLAQEGS